MKKWTKTDIKSLRGALDHWWMGVSMYLRDPRTSVADVFSAMPLEDRQKIVVAHFRGFGSMLTDRADKNAQTANHARTTTVWGSSAGEIAERFDKLEKADRAAAAKANALADRVASEGLPPELLEYVPGS